MNLNEQALELLYSEKIQEFNEFRLKNIIFRPNLSGQDFSKKVLSSAFLNGAICSNTDFRESKMEKINLVQAELNGSNFESADLTQALLMYAEMKNCILKNCNLKQTNFMWTDLQNSDLRGSYLDETIFIESYLNDTKLDDLKKEKAYTKYAKLDNTIWKV
jgi:uncharacterized protein YjbI with pentapeptide repeats